MLDAEQPAPPPEQQPDQPDPPKRRLHPVVEVLVILAAAVGVYLVTNYFVVKPYRIPSASMVPTLEVGDRVLVSRFIYHLHDPERGDVIVFHPPGHGDQPQRGADTPADVYFIKRIVGLPGEVIEARDGQVKICDTPVSGCEPLDEPYLAQQGVMPDFGPITVPDDSYFMMGDNRADSDDSRDWGPLPRDYITGEAFFTYWPPDRIGLLDLATML